jgi:bacteriocin-like protein
MNNQNEIRELTVAEELTDDALESVSGGKVISKGVTNSSAISLPKPAYPATA